MTAKFGKAQQVQVFEDEGLPLFDGRPAEPKPDNGKRKSCSVEWKNSIWSRWFEMVAPEQDDQHPAAEQKPLF